MIYTDGSISERRRVSSRMVASWAFVVVERKKFNYHKKGVLVAWSNGSVCTDPMDPLYIGAKRATVNTAELSGIYWALSYCYRQKIKEATIYSDSKYSVNGVTGAASATANKELVRRAREVLFGKDPEYKLNLLWVKAHVGHKFNEMADRFAKVVLSEYI